MISKAHVAYYIPALSKYDIKPFLKIKNFLLGFAGCCFFQKLPPEGRLNHETYVYTFWHNTNNSPQNWILYSFLLLAPPQWAQFWEPWQAQKDWKENQKDWKEKIQDFSTSLNNFGSRKNLQRGAAAASAAPFVGFFAPKILRTAAEGLGFFPFNPLGLARALKTGLIGGWARRNTKFNFSANYLCCNRKCKHKLQVWFGPPGVQQSKKQDLQNQACHFFLIACYLILIPDSEST